jgi:four helix bundle protein
MNAEDGEREWPRPHFRFEDLEIWRLARDLAVKFHEVADRLESQKLFRYAEQLRGAGLSVSNNIAEGSGSIHQSEFSNFLNIARRSLFENASMVLVFAEMDILEPNEVTELLEDTDHLSRKLTNFKKRIDGSA